MIPGIANWYASVCRQCPAACGINVKVLEGQAKKIEGNPDYPINKGRICTRGQAGLQVLYNPDRIRTPLIKINNKFKQSSWKEAIDLVSQEISSAQKVGPNKVVFIGEQQRGSLSKLISTFFNNFGNSNVYYYEYFDDKVAMLANKQCFGYEGLADYDIANTRSILSFNTNFLENWISPVKHAVSYGDMRDLNLGNKEERGWLIQLEPRMTLTGSNADDWFPIKANTEGLVAMSIAYELVNEGLHTKALASEAGAWKQALKDFSPASVAGKAGISEEKIKNIAKKFASLQPGIAICGGAATAQEEGLFNAIAANIINHLVGLVNVKGGIKFPNINNNLGAITPTASFEQLSDLGNKMGDGEIEVACIHNTNPVYSLPSSTGFAKNLEKVPFKVSFSSFMDDTTALADVILPDSTFLESWSDFIPLVDNGSQTIGLAQPSVDKVFDTQMLGDTLIAISKVIGGDIASSVNTESFFSFLQNSWQNIYASAKLSKQSVKSSFNAFWNNSVQRGGFWQDSESFFNPTQKPKPSIIPKIVSKNNDKEKLSLLLYPAAGLYDGRGANQPWLQQLPEPLVTGAWMTWAEINPEKANELNISEGDLIELKSENGKITLPAYIYPAIEPETIAVPIGRGHKKFGRYAKSNGQNILSILNDLKNSDTGSLAWASTKVSLSKTGGSEQIVKTEPLQIIPSTELGMREHEREIVQWISPEKFEEEKNKLLEPIEALAEHRRDDKETDGYRWGMVIDLDKCTGCEACMVACYAENNLPIVNAKQLLKNRHKNWIRVDRYWEGEYPKIRAKILPANCYQCGKASCEPVCPVYAAFTTNDNINGQVYQRCVGTRYCNVACPYRARLFNWFKGKWPEPLNMQLNPEISVRTAGVTEKCSFCVQRIRQAKDKAKDENRRVKDGEIQPACAQTCPSGAIVFGDLLNKKSQVSKLTKNPRRYRVLEELDTEPAVVYLKAIRNSAVKHKEESEEQRGEHG